MIANAKYANEDNTIIQADFDGGTLFVPVAAGNRHYREILDSGAKIEAYQVPVESDAAWRARCEVTKRQMFRALHASGTLDNVKSAINVAGGVAKVDFDTAGTFKRLDDFVSQLKSAMGWNDNQIDAVFRSAEQMPK